MRQLPPASDILAANLAAYMRDDPEKFGTAGKIGRKAQVDQRTVDRIAKNEHVTKLDTLDAIARAFNVPAYMLLIPGLNPKALPIFDEEELEREVNKRVFERLEKLIPEAKRLVVGDEEEPTGSSVADPFPNSGRPQEKRAGPAGAKARPAQQAARKKAKRT